MRAVMARLGNVHEHVPMVHVAGTNGKGSTCAMIERTLREAGYRTGLYTSPYIEKYNERIRIDGKPIEGEKLAALVESIWPVIEAVRDEGLCITEFELGTVLAYAAFAREKVDIAIIEATEILADENKIHEIIRNELAEIRRKFSDEGG